MKVSDSVEYLVARAYQYGYTDTMIQQLAPELVNLVYELGDECDQEDLDKLFEEYF